MRILEEFWYGKLEPADCDVVDCKEHNEALRRIDRSEEKLLDTMTDEQKELFSAYMDAVHEYQSITDCLLFQNSFKLGARMVLEVMENK